MLPARDRLIAAAMTLFYEQGIHTSGIDAITKHAGVAKMTLYNNFASKDELLRLYLELSHQRWAECYDRRLTSAESSQVAALAVFDAHLENFQQSYRGRFRGCPLLNAAAELPLSHPVRELIAHRKYQAEVDIEGQLARVSFPRADRREIARHISFLLEGGLCVSGLQMSIAPLENARRLASGLLTNREDAA